MKKMKKLFAVLLAFAMVMGMSLTTFAAEGEVPNGTQKTEAKVLNVESTATVTAYRVVEGNYNAEGLVDYKFVSDAVAALVTLETDEKCVDLDSGDVTNIAKAIDAGTLVLDEKHVAAFSVDAATIDTTTNLATFKAKLSAGYWVVLVDGNVFEVYNPMLIGVYYSVAGSDPTLNDENDGIANNEAVVNANTDWSLTVNNAYAKSSNTWITKNANGTTWDLGDEVTYTVTAKVPDYSDEYVDSSIVYKIVDDITSGELVIDDVKDIVITSNKDIDADDYELTLAANGEGYTVVFDGAWISENANATITITYVARITGEIYATNSPNLSLADETNDSHDNTVTLEYTNAPGSTNKAEAKESIFTFAIFEQITKIGEEDEDEDGELDALPNATFTIYTNEACTEEYKYTNLIHADGTVVSDADGYINLRGLDLGTYFIKETIAPTGYSLNEKVYKVVIEATETINENASDDVTNITVTLSENGQTGSDSLTIPNTKLSGLPSTGGIGTAVFTIGGCAIMIAAAYFFFVSRKKEA